jgi:hypothetical protein
MAFLEVAIGEEKDIILKTKPCGYYKESSSTCYVRVQIYAWYYVVYPFTQKFVQVGLVLCSTMEIIFLLFHFHGLG